MNKIFKVIWCKSSQTWIAVSELCKMKPISSVTQTERKSSHTLFSQLTKFSALSTLLLIPYSANAYVAIGATNNSGYAVSTGATAIYDLQEDGTPPYNYMNPGSKSYANKDAPNSGDKTLYYDGKATGIAIGNNTNALNKDNASNGIAIGDYSRATGGLAMSLGSFSTADSNGAVAIGTSSRASGVNSLSMMRQSSATGDYSTAIGSVAWSAGQSSFALGASATAKGNQSIAIGSLEQKKSADGLGTPITKYNGLDNTQTNGDRSMALGTNAKTNGDDSFAIGYKSRTGEFNTVMDSYLGENVMSADSNKKANKAIAVGTNTLAQKESSIALGYEANSLGINAISIGANAKAEHDNVVAIGQTATATESGSMAIGQGAKSTFKNSLALGTGTIVNNVDGGKSKFTAQDYNVENGVISIANVGKERRIINLAAGRNDTDAVNVAQLQYVNKNLAKSIGGDNYTGYSDADNHNYKAPEFDIKNTQYNNVKAAVEAAQTNYVSVNSTNKANDSNYDNKGAKGSGSIALGDTTSTDAAATNSIAIGLRTSVTGSNTVAIGAGITAATSGSVVLGDSSSTEGSHPTANVNSATVNGHTYNGFAGTVKGAGHFMSVGSKGTERQIKNVAAGHVAADSTDAINGSQLFSVASRIEQGWNISSEAAANGTVSGTNAAQTIKPGSAVKLLAGKNLNINQDGSNFTFSTKENVSFENITTQNLTATGNTSVKNFTVQNGGTVNMGNNRVTGVASPTDGTDAVNKQYVDNLKFKYVADNSTKGENLLSAETHFLGKADEIVTKAENGKVSFALADKAKASLAKADTAMQDFIVGADTAHNASGISLNQTNKRFDVVGVNDVATKVNGNSIEVDLAQTTKTTITKHTTDIADNKQKITDNTGNIATNTAEIAKGFGLEAQDGGHVNKKLGQNVKVVGGNNNINTSVSNGEVKINLSNTLDLGNSGSVTIGDTLLNNNGLAITNGPTIAKAGINAGNKKITGVEEGTDDSDAVNVKQLKRVIGGAASTETVEKKTAQAGDDNLAEITVADGKSTGDMGAKYQLSVSKKAVQKAAQDAIKVSGTSPITVNKTTDNNGVDDYAVSFNGAEAAKSIPLTYKANGSNAQTVYLNEGLNFTNGTMTTASVANDGVVKYDVNLSTIKVENGKAAVAGTPVNGANGTDGKDGVATVQNVVDALNNAAWTVTASKSEGEVTGNVSKEVKNGDTVTYDAGKNIKITQNDKKFSFATKDNVEFTSVTTGDTKLTTNGVEITNGPKLTQAGIDAGNKKITDVADGNVAVGSKEAVNGGQLFTETTKAKTTVEKGDDNIQITPEIAADGHTNYKVALKPSLTVGPEANGHPITINGNDGHITGLTNKDWTGTPTSGRAATEDQLSVVDKKFDNKVSLGGDNGSTTEKALSNTGGIKFNIKGGDSQKYVTTTASGDDVTVDLTQATKEKIDNAADKHLSNITNDGKKAITALGNIVEAADGTITVTDETDNITGKKTYKIKANIPQPEKTAMAAGKNTVVDGDGSAANPFKVDLKDNLELGQKDVSGVTGKDSSIKVNGKDGSSVAINGKDGAITLNGKDGTNPVTLKTTQGPAGLNGTAPKDRLTVNNEAVATLQDGLQFAGDNGDNEVIRKTLNQKLDIVGGADKTKLSDNNIGVNANNGKLEVKLAKELNDLTSAQFKNGDNTTVINGNGMTITPKDPTKVVSLTDKGLNNGGNQIVNIDSGLKQADGSTVALKDATGDTLKNAVNVGDLKESINDITDATKNGGFGLSDDNGTTAKANLGETVKVKGDGSVVTKVVTDNGKPTLQVGLAKDITVGDNTNPGTITVKGENGKDGVSINGKDGAITLNGKDGTNPVTLKTTQGPAGLNGTAPKDRLTVNNEAVATLQDGLQFAGDNGDNEVIRKTLNQKLDIVGGADKTKLSDNNIGVNANNGKLEVKLAKELNDLTSAQFKNGDNTTVINGNGMTITPKDPTKVVSLTDKGLNNGGNQIVNIDSGLKQADGSTVALKDATGDTLKNAVNVGDLKESINDITDATKNGGFGLSDDNGTTAKANLGETVKVKGDGSVVTKVVTDNGKPTLQVGLAKDITVGDNTNPGTISVKGENGKDGVSINGKEGSIGLNGKDGVNASITVAQGKAGVDGKDGESKTRITYEITNPDGSKTPEQVATLNDGMKFVGNDGKVVTRKLNDTLSITGGINNPTVLADNQQVSGNNVGVRYKDQGGLEVVMKERPEFSGVVVNGKDGKDASVTFAKDGKDGMSLAGSRDAEGKDAITIKGKDGKDGVSFKDDGRITNVADGVDDKDAVNKSQLDKGIAQATSRVDAGKNITVTPQKNADGSTTYTVETKDDVEFTSVKSGDTTMDNNGISITGGPSVTKDGINANDKKITGVQDGDISATSKDAVNGSQLHQTNQNVNNLTTTVNKGLNFQGDNQEVTVNRKLGDQLNIRGGANPKKLTQNNIGVVADKNGTMTVQMAKDVNLGPDGSLTVGNTTVNNDGVAIKGGPSMTQSGINAGGKRISNVARGKAPNDAVNMSQLQETSNAINNRIDNIDNRVNKMDKRRKAGTASALATAGLMQPHRDGQSALVAAVGQYQSETAVAVGYSRISDNGKYGVKVSFSTNSQGEVGGTAGAGYFW